MERDLNAIKCRFCKNREDGPSHEGRMESPLQEVQWERELAVQNIRAKKEMAMELREMGFASDAVARVLHLDEQARDPGEDKRIGHVHATEGSDT